ncbi:sugar ABC transporter permease [Fodinisporobacter ferrooxydans]|uniref:Sugar ABC transporter permease n=1 Tax=Fodinisporobacter ferrooxydans TaxID=2901836 RepID=A0ABY4CSH0_9BACL|nr:sugar ABC transporter permease [Alicyclobacillaceae bacterium MYW30-H2]
MNKGQWKIGLVFLLPFLVMFFLFKLGPALAGLLASLSSWNLVGNPHFVGLKNFYALLRDLLFWTSVRNTLYFLVLTAPALIVGGLLLAVLLNQPIPGKGIARTAIFTPYIVMSTVVGVIWNWLYDTHFGLLNYYLGVFGIKPIPWLTDPRWAMIAISITTFWWLVGYNMIIFLAGLQEIPAEIYEAATIDGANSFNKFIRITIPLLKPSIFVVIMLTLISCIQVFDQVYVMTGGGPDNSTMTIVQYLYVQAFQNYNLGYGAAIGVVIFLFLAIIGLLQMYVTRERKAIR